ncbi:hypothetical protein [Herbaspirillum sp. SJZ107]|uniref:hypothetical protein n=1 Tax=Herbaspirillum sp. SJZ107 TaxID=2572881 RepID=UPI0011514E6F|nr:hypothetical protein [Herbaspirillum sp. SJZ107]TQK10267.1 hypothetical protein FBX97_0183 [Herbaspirillum sp. SJZ107]
MAERKDTITASRVDLILALLPIISLKEAVQSMVDSGVPADVAARVLNSPEQRRPMQLPTFLE